MSYIHAFQNDEKVAKYCEGAKAQIAAFEKYLGSKKFFIGDKVCLYTCILDMAHPRP